MSAYICDNKTISALAIAFVDYATRDFEFKAEDFEMPSLCGVIFNESEMKQAVGQRLLKQNYDSVNAHYDEDTPVPEFELEEVEINEGIVYSCIREYNYQACETEDYFDSKLYDSLMALQRVLLERLIKRNGWEITWGYPLEEVPQF